MSRVAGRAARRRASVDFPAAIVPQRRYKVDRRADSIRREYHRSPLDCSSGSSAVIERRRSSLRMHTLAATGRSEIQRLGPPASRLLAAISSWLGWPPRLMSAVKGSLRRVSAAADEAVLHLVAARVECRRPSALEQIPIKYPSSPRKRGPRTSDERLPLGPRVRGGDEFTMPA